MASGQETPLVVHAERAAEPDELGKIVRMSAREIAARLGALRAEESSSLKAQVGPRTESLDETVALEIDRRGEWHGERENSHEQGVEAWSAGGQLIVKMRYGKAVRRRPEGGEADRLREDLFGDAGAYYDLLERFVQPSDGGKVQQAGRSARHVLLALRTSPRSLPAEGWRADMKVSALAGSIDVDEQTGAPLRVELRARYSHPKGKNEAQVDLSLVREIKDIGQTVAVAAPSDVIDSPVRTRYELEKRELLEGLAADRQSGGR